MGYLHLGEIQDIIRKELKIKSGIYGFVCKSNNKLYIGSSKILDIRFNVHIKGTRSNIVLQNAINKYNLQDFVFIVFEYCKPEDLISREQLYIDALKPEFNILKTAGSWLGYKHSIKTITKMSIAKTGKNNPMFGKNLTAETIAKISEANKGKIASVETRAKLSKSQKSIDRIGINNPASRKVFVFSFESETNEYILSNSFITCTETAKHFKCSVKTISIHLKSGKIFQKKWILSSILDFKQPS